MYQALYRKYRPQVFDDVIGQEHITGSLKNQIESGRLSHAYIFIGTRGTGKTTCARILAKAVNCEHPVNGNPCCECDSCRGIADGTIMDIVELDAASNNGVDNVRMLRDEAVFSPANVRKRVYIIDEVHMLSTPAFNALLKILEEPPEHLIFVLATTELQKVPATILSRCQRHTFKRIPQERLASYLKEIAVKENIGLTDEAAMLLAGLGEGSVRDSLSMLDQCSNFGNIGVEEVYDAVGLAGNKRTTSLFECILNRDSAGALSVFSSMWNDGKDPSVVMKELCSLARDVMLTKLAPRTADTLIYGGYDRAELNRLSASVDEARLVKIADELAKCLGNMSNPKVSAEICIAKLCSSGASEPAIENKSTVAPQQVAKMVLKPEPATIKPEPPAAAVPEQVLKVAESEEPTGEQADFWYNVCSAVKGDIPFDLGLQLNNTDILVGSLEGNVLVIKVAAGFYYVRFNRAEVLEAFSKAAGEVAGKQINVRFAEMSAKTENKLSLDDLANFSEVKFEN